MDLFLWTILQLQISMLKNEFNCANMDNISFFFFQIFFFVCFMLALATLLAPILLTYI